VDVGCVESFSSGLVRAWLLISHMLVVDIPKLLPIESQRCIARREAASGPVGAVKKGPGHDPTGLRGVLRLHMTVVLSQYRAY
jgi:hypothetical protein